MNLSRFSLLAIPFCSLLLGACVAGECLENHSALPLASFYNKQTLRQITIPQLSIYGIGAPADSILYTPQSLSSAYLPFRLWQDTTQYVFAYPGLAVKDDEEEEEAAVVPSDTVTFIYHPKEWFVSPSCGAMYFYEMNDVIHTSLLIDSIAFNPLITNENTTNVQIFFRDYTNE